MARKNRHPDASAMDRLIERSVEQALAIWLARATQEIWQELLADPEFRKELLKTARAATDETLERVRTRRIR